MVVVPEPEEVTMVADSAAEVVVITIIIIVTQLALPWAPVATVIPGESC